MTTENEQSHGASVAVQSVVIGLDERMAAAGMVPVSQMLEQNTLGKFSAHAGVTDLDKFEEWIQMRREEFIRMQARMTLDGEENDELFEWVVAHNAVLGEVMASEQDGVDLADAGGVALDEHERRNILRQPGHAADVGVFADGHEVVNDTVGSEPIAVTW